MATDEWFEVIPSQKIAITVHVVRRNIVVHPFTKELLCIGSQFYINRISCESSMGKNRVYEYDKTCFGIVFF